MSFFELPTKEKYDSNKERGKGRCWLCAINFCMISSYCASVFFPPTSPTYTVTYLSVLPAHITYIMTHIYLSNIWLPEHRYVKTSMLVRLKTRIKRQWNPIKCDPKFQETRSPMRYHISIESLNQKCSWHRSGWRRKISAAGGDQTLPWPMYSKLQLPVASSHKTTLKEQANPSSDTSSIDHLVMREFVSGPPRYHLALKGIREQFVVLESSSGL